MFYTPLQIYGIDLQVSSNKHVLILQADQDLHCLQKRRYWDLVKRILPFGFLTIQQTLPTQSLYDLNLGFTVSVTSSLS